MAKISALLETTALTGAEFLPIVQGGVTKRSTMAAFRDLIVPFLQNWYKGDPGPAGPADGYRLSLALLRAAKVSDGKSDFDGSTWYWTAGNFDQQDDGLTLVASDHVPLTEGAWIRRQPRGAPLAIARQVDAVGGVLYIASGSSDAKSIKLGGAADTHLEGEGWSSGLTIDNPNQAAIEVGSLSQNQTAQILLRNFRLFGKSSTANAFRIRRQQGLAIRDIRASGFTDYALDVTASYATSYLNVYTNNGGGGWHLQPPYAGMGNDFISIHHSFALAHSAHGLLSEGYSPSLHLFRSDFEGNRKTAVKIDAGSTGANSECVGVEWNYFENNADKNVEIGNDQGSLTVGPFSLRGNLFNHGLASSDVNTVECGPQSTHGVIEINAFNDSDLKLLGRGPYIVGPNKFGGSAKDQAWGSPTPPVRYFLGQTGETLVHGFAAVGNSVRHRSGLMRAGDVFSLAGNYRQNPATPTTAVLDNTGVAGVGIEITPAGARVVRIAPGQGDRAVTHGSMTLPVVATADLPAAGAWMDGQHLIEDEGTALNIIIYAGGKRARIAGVLF